MINNNNPTFSLFKNQENILVRIPEGWAPPSGLYGWRPTYRNVQYKRADIVETHIKTLEAELQKAKTSEVFWRDGWYALDEDKRKTEVMLTETLAILEECEIMLRLRGHTEIANEARNVLAKVTEGKNE